MHRGQIITLRIENYAFGGRGIGYFSEDNTSTTVFVDNAFPGQLVSAKIDKKRKKYAEAKLLEVLERSHLEQRLPYQEISGAPYIFVPVEIQEEFKQKSTLETFRRLADLPDLESKFDGFVASPIHYFYRNKMEYSFSSIEHIPETGEEKDNAFALGFKRRGTWWKVENLNRPSGLFDEEWERKLPELRDCLQATHLPAWHPPQKKGFFRHIVVRKSFFTNELLINLITSSENLESFNLQRVVDKLKELWGDRIAGFWHTVNDNVADRAKIENGSSQLLFGEPKIVEELLGLRFEISMESFFQTNPKSAELLYNQALDYVFAEPIPSGEVVMDLFCGTGTIGQILSQRSAGVEVIGVDIVEEAIRDAKLNAQRNGIQNVTFYASDVGKFLKEKPEYIGKIHSIVLDPPRAGIAPKTLQKVIDLGAKHIVYISCNPSTQARDTLALKVGGYVLDKLSLVDQFPHTGHIESVAKFVRRS